MSQSLIRFVVHIIFSTKNRQPLITNQLENELYSYIGGILKNKNCQVIKIGGTSDHIHILCFLAKDITIAKLLEELKMSTSKWAKSNRYGRSDFYWQSGYGAFSVQASEIKKVAEYIDNQKEHHKTKSFQEEYIAILQKLNIQYNEQYLWT